MGSALDVLRMMTPPGLQDPRFEGADARFCELTDAANRAFGEGEDEAATRIYEEALKEAERLFHAAQVGGSPLIAPMVHTIACHNIAEAKRRTGDIVAVLNLKRHAVEKLVGTAESPLDPLGLRVNCVRHLRHALGFLAEDLERLDADQRAEFDRLLERCRAVDVKLGRLARYELAAQVSASAKEAASPSMCRLN